MREIVVDSFAGAGGASLGISLALGRAPDVAINHDAAAIAVHAANHPGTRHIQEKVWKADPAEVTRGRPVGLLWASPDCKHFSRAKGGKPVDKTIRSLAWVVVRWALACQPRVIILENVREFEDWGPLLPAWRCRACNWRGTEGQATLARTRRRCPRCNSSRLGVTKEEIPDPTRLGLTFKRFCGRLRGLGYQVRWKVLNAADYGAPTHRRRLFLVARRDGLPIVWPEPTHGDPGKLDDVPLFAEPRQPWRTAAECIDWSLPCPSIFLSKKEGRAIGVKRPLVAATLRRVALGVKRYVLDNPRPFIIRCAHGGTGRWGSGVEDPDSPLPTATSSKDFAVVTPYVVGCGGRAGQSPATGGDAPVGTVTAKNDRAVVTPVIVPLTHAGERRAYSPEEPLAVVTGANRGELAAIAPCLARIGQTGGNGKYCNGVEEPATTVTSQAEHILVSPTLIQTGYGEAPGQAPRVPGLDKPLGTCVNGGKHALVAAFLQQYYGANKPSNEHRSANAAEPLRTVTVEPRHSVVSAYIAKHYGGVVGVPADVPLPTTTERGTQNQVAAATLVRFNHDDAGVSVDQPAPTVTTNNHAGLVAANLIRFNHGEKQWNGVDEPHVTVTTGNHAFLVYSFLTSYFGESVGHAIEEPLATGGTRDRFGLVTVDVDGETYVIVDIGMRMLTPRELARCQGFPDSYQLPGEQLAGTKTQAVGMIGNSVSPPVAKALVEANYAKKRRRAAV